MTEYADTIFPIEAMRRANAVMTDIEYATRRSLAEFSRAMATERQRTGLASIFPDPRLWRARRAAWAVVNTSPIHQRWLRQVLLSLPRDAEEQRVFPTLLTVERETP